MILRALIVRAIAAAGMLPQFSLHHSPNNNAFALADDLIEPFRPFIDRCVMQILPRKTTSELEGLDKKKLLETLYDFVVIASQKIPLINAVLSVALSLTKVLTKEQKKLVLPEFV